MLYYSIRNASNGFVTIGWPLKTCKPAFWLDKRRPPMRFLTLEKGPSHWYNPSFRWARGVCVCVGGGWKTLLMRFLTLDKSPPR